eukprot:GHVT01069709.1.p1 GENE.GHVT01069709.1~~GHVT01069709.1.p1  ORF type:complete len:147 (-),score=12.17 GHVT01069709.1:1593-2033(-)
MSTPKTVASQSNSIALKKDILSPCWASCCRLALKMEGSKSNFPAPKKINNSQHQTAQFQCKCGLFLIKSPVAFVCLAALGRVAFEPVTHVAMFKCRKEEETYRNAFLIGRGDAFFGKPQCTHIAFAPLLSLHRCQIPNGMGIAPQR